MRKRNRKKSKTSYLFNGIDKPASSWRRHVGRNKKIHMAESKKHITYE